MEIPKFLNSTYVMLSETFPNGIREEDYWIVLYLLYDYMSDRNLALVISYLVNKSYEMILNDIYGISYMEFDSGFVSEIQHKLDVHSFEDWKKEE